MTLYKLRLQLAEGSESEDAYRSKPVNGRRNVPSTLTVDPQDIFKVLGSDITVRGKPRRLRGACLGGWGACYLSHTAD
jgi:hypothetical protein